LFTNSAQEYLRIELGSAGSRHYNDAATDSAFGIAVGLREVRRWCLSCVTATSPKGVLLVWLVIIACFVLLVVMVVFLLLLSSSSKNDYEIPRGDGDIKPPEGETKDMPRPEAVPPSTASVSIEPSAAAGSQSSVSIKQADIGDLLRISDSGEFAGDLEFRVAGRTRYESDKDVWHELHGRCRGRRIYVEVFSSGSDIGLVLPNRPITLGDLRLNEDDLIRFDEGAAAGERVMYDGATWEFAWSGEVRCSGDATPHDRDYYGWDFVEQNGQRVLCVEKREGEPFEVCMVRMIGVDRAQVTRK
jgi:hypothetical protein